MERSTAAALRRSLRGTSLGATSLAATGDRPANSSATSVYFGDFAAAGEGNDAPPTQISAITGIAPARNFLGRFVAQTAFDPETEECEPADSGTPGPSIRPLPARAHALTLGTVCLGLALLVGLLALLGWA